MGKKRGRKWVDTVQVELVTHLPVRLEDGTIEGSVLPSFHETVATMEGGPVASISRSMTHPFVFYLHSAEEGPNGHFAITLNITSTMEEIIRRFGKYAPEYVKEDEGS